MKLSADVDLFLQGEISSSNLNDTLNDPQGGISAVLTTFGDTFYHEEDNQKHFNCPTVASTAYVFSKIDGVTATGYPDGMMQSVAYAQTMLSLAYTTQSVADALNHECTTTQTQSEFSVYLHNMVTATNGWYNIMYLGPNTDISIFGAFVLKNYTENGLVWDDHHICELFSRFRPDFHFLCFLQTKNDTFNH